MATVKDERESINAKHARRTGQPAFVTTAADGHPTRATNRGPARAALMALISEQPI